MRDEEELAMFGNRIDGARRRRRWWRLLAVAAVTVLAAGLAACGGDDDDDGGGDGSATEGDAVSVGYISVAPVTSGNWEPANYSAFTNMVAKYGFDATNQESVAYDQAAPVLERLAPDNDVVIADSSGYAEAVLQVAPEFPDTQFVVVSDLASTEGNENLSGWAINWNEYGYLQAAAACPAAQSVGGDTIGHVNSEPIPAFTRWAAGERDGADELGCNWETAWINSFSDVAKAKQAALAMIDDGAEVITSSADTADQGSREAAVEEDTFFVGNYAESDNELDPEHTITSVVVNFEQAYDEIGALASNGELGGQIEPIDVQNGGLFYAPFQNVDAEVEDQANETFEQIMNGEIEVDPTAEVTP